MRLNTRRVKTQENVAADSLSRASHGELLQLLVSAISTKLWDLILAAYASDPQLQQLKEQITDRPDLHIHYKVVDGFLFRKYSLVVSNDLHVRDLISQWLHTCTLLIRLDTLGLEA